MRLLLPLPGSEVFSAKMAAAGGFELGVLEFRRFPDAERYVRIAANPNVGPSTSSARTPTSIS